MKLWYVEMCGFRGYRTTLRIEFADGFTIIDGRNGVGKSTLFDAVEFALTGTLTKYSGAKADGESVADYIWWAGEGSTPLERYVEVGFRDGEWVRSVRRSQLEEPDLSAIDEITGRLCDITSAPPAALNELCAAAIIRDEHITSLSLDLKEVDRYALLRGSLGANDSDKWISRGAHLLAAAKKRSQLCEQEVA